LLPLLDIGAASSIFLRATLTLQVVLWLGTLEGMRVCEAILPWKIFRVWRGDLGETALAIVGSEALNWGYALFGVNDALAWAFLIAGALVMMRFAQVCLSRGIVVPKEWRYVNYVYIVTCSIQLLHTIPTSLPLHLMPSLWLH
jgi:hypothetical protein